MSISAHGLTPLGFPRPLPNCTCSLCEHWRKLAAAKTGNGPSGG